MTTIHLTTMIKAPAERVFDLARSVKMHRLSMKDHDEQVVSSVNNDLLQLQDTVTWKARHILKQRILKVKITAMDAFTSFTDEQVAGDFKAMRHQHFFKPVENGTLMIDYFHFDAPYGVLGSFFRKVYLAGYIRRLLEKRNEAIRQYAESELWKQVLHV